MKPLRIQVSISEPALVQAIEERVARGESAGYAAAVVDLLKVYRGLIAALGAGERAAPAPAAVCNDEERLTF